MLVSFVKLPSMWHNELGSTMTVTSLNLSKGRLEWNSKYNSAVGEAENDYDVVGKFDTDGDTLGWVASYQNKYLNAHSTCTWSGHIELSPCKEQKPVILTTWLLTSQTSHEDDWQSTNVGFDTFTAAIRRNHSWNKILRKQYNF